MTRTLAAGIAAALAIALAPTTIANAAPADPTVNIEEDDPRWDCRTMGNHECGPDNAQGVPAGDYGEIDYEAHTEWLIDTNEGR